MNKSKYILLCLLAVSGLCPSAYTYAAKKAEAQAITQTDSNHYYGRGYGKTYEEACRGALANLLSNITVTVQGKFTSTSHESVNGDTVESKEEMNSVVESFSGATTLHDVQYATESTTPEYCVVSSVSKENVAKMFELRRDKVYDLVLSAQRAEQRGNVSTALRYLYQAYVLLFSLQHPYEVKEKVDGEERLLVNWIPERMNEICTDVRFSIVSNDNNVYNVLVTYKGEPALAVDYSYWNGKHVSPVMSAKDGMGEMIFPEGVRPTKMKVELEYQYRDEVNSDPQVAPLLESFQGNSVVRDNVKILDFSQKTIMATKEEKKVYAESLTAGQAEGVATVDKVVAKDYSGSMREILKAISAKNYDSVADKFTEEGLDMFQKLLKYGKARLLAGADKVDFKFYPMKERVVCRSIPMSFTFNNGKKQFIEDVTFTFNADGKVESLAFGLGSEATKSVFSQGGDKWSDYTKMVIVSFLENYKTAFALKRLDYIKSIFDDNAYIIVGHVVKKSPTAKSGDLKMALQKDEHVEYFRKSKTEYIDQLEKCFNSNEYVNIRFSDNDIAKSGYGGEVYGIQIKQDYSSQHYGDHGYLFLMVDFNDDETPIITIRTWQPERMKDITPMLPKNSRDYGIFSIGSFS